MCIFYQARLFSLNLFQYQHHSETNSDHLFKSLCWSACKMSGFSAKQRLQCLVPLVYLDDLQTMTMLSAI